MPRDVVFLCLVMMSIAGSTMFYYIRLSDGFSVYPHVEHFDIFYHCAMKNGTAFQWSDLWSMWDKCFDGNASRPRFFSWLFWIVDIKTRYLLFSTSFFHPTFSLVWIVNLIFIPVAFYYLMFEILGDKFLALLSTVVINFSTPVIAFSTLYFHAGKSMSFFLIIINLLVTARLSKKVCAGEVVRKIFYVKWFFVLLLSMFWDELFYVFFITAPVLFYPMFKNNVNRNRVFLLVLLLFAIFCGMSFYVAPYLTLKVKGEHYSWVGEVFHSESSFNIQLSQVWYNVNSLINTMANPLPPIVSYNWWRGTPYSSAITWLFILGCSFLVYFRKKIPKELLYSVLCFVPVIVFLQLLLTRRGGELMFGTFYWGAPFAIYFCIFAGNIFKELNQKCKPLVLVLSVVFICSGLGNSDAAIKGHILSTYVETFYPGLDALKMSDDFGSISQEKYDEIWSQRFDVDKLKENLVGIPKNYAWMYYEAVFFKKYKNLQYVKWELED